MEEYSIADVGCVNNKNNNKNTNKNTTKLENFIEKELSKLHKNTEQKDTLELMTGFTYDELLKRCLEKIQNKKESQKTVKKLKPINIKFENRRTVLYDFTDILNALDRPAEHLFAYITSELQTEGSIKENDTLSLKGRFNARCMENIIKKYKEQYVSCSNCKDDSTILQKDNIDRLFYVICNYCKSKKSDKTFNLYKKMKYTYIIVILLYIIIINMLNQPTINLWTLGTFHMINLH